MKKRRYPRISVIILNYNGINITPTVLDSIKKLNYPSKRIETLVVDNASTDGSVEMIFGKYPFVKVLKMKQNLAYGAFNLAIKECTGEFSLLLNNDIEIHPNCLKELLKIFDENKDAVIAAPAIYDFKTRKLAYTKKYISRSFYNGSDHNSHISAKDDLNIHIESYTGVPFIKTSFARSLPYVFDPDYFLYVEDVDLAYRIRLLGHTIFRSNKAILYHDANATTNLFFTTPFKNYLIERNMLQTYIKNLELKNIILWFPFLIIPRLIKLLIYFFTARFFLFSSSLSAYYWNVVNLRTVLNKRITIQSNRKILDNEVLKEMGSEIAVLKYLFSK